MSGLRGAHPLNLGLDAGARVMPARASPGLDEALTSAEGVEDAPGDRVQSRRGPHFRGGLDPVSK